MSSIKLSEIPLYKKFQLADIAGYKVIKTDNRCELPRA